MNAVSLQNLTRVFPVPFRRERLVAVRDLSLEVPEGEVYGLLGPNGSGKSTTLKMLLGLVTPTSGTAHVFGQDSRAFAARSEVGFLPENPYFYKFLTGAETLRFYGKLCGLRGVKLEARLEQVQEVCDRVGIMARGRLLREGNLDELVSVDSQTQFVVENAPPELAAQIEALVAKSGAQLVETRRPQRTLERVFLEVTQTAENPPQS